MRLHSACFSVTSGLGLALLSFAASLELTAVPERSANGADHGSIAPDGVNRALKGDRLRIIIRPPDGAPLRSAPTPELPEGCDSAIGRVRPSSSAKLAQSCVT